MLGPSVGPAVVRRESVRSKVDDEQPKLAKLRDFPNQHDLRTCFQQELRLLQCTFKTSDLDNPWTVLDAARRRAARSVRGRLGDEKPLSDAERKVYAESCSVLGRKWLSATMLQAKRRSAMLRGRSGSFRRW